MKVILLGSFPTSNLLFESLLNNNLLQAVCFEEDYVNLEVNDTLKNNNLPFFNINKKNINTDFKDWLQKQNTDLVIVCGFSLKIPEELLTIPSLGFYNIHFGKLPTNRGPVPLFWSLKNGETETAITIHKIDNNWDSGDIVLEQKVPIIKGETLGMLNSKMSFFLKDLGLKAINLIKSNSVLQAQSEKENIIYNKRPSSVETSIDWDTQTAEEIENLVNACNPKYGGATTYYQKAPIKIIEVSPVDNQTPLFGTPPGTIIHAHPQDGIFVCCKYGQLLRINIINSDAGILTGNKYVNLGLQQGHCFTSNNYSIVKQEISQTIV